MSDHSYAVERALTTALELADWASQRIRQGPEKVEAKEHPADHVTETDREIEQRVRGTLAENFSGDALVGEEYGGSPDVPLGLGSATGRTWYLDPVDGTTNYAHGLGWSSFSLALTDPEGPLLGVVADPYRGEVFSAVRGGEARLDGEPIHCREATALEGELVTTEWLGYQPWPGMEQLLQRLADSYCSVRIMGSTALSLVSVAAGRATASVIGNYNAIDGLAASFIAERAGAVCRAEDGTNTVFPDSGGILVASPGVVDAMYAAWRPSR